MIYELKKTKIKAEHQTYLCIAVRLGRHLRREERKAIRLFEADFMDQIPALAEPFYEAYDFDVEGFRLICYRYDTGFFFEVTRDGKFFQVFDLEVEI